MTGVTTCARPARSALRLLLGTSALLALAGPAQAHKSSDAYLSFRAQGTQLTQRVDIALRDLDRELLLDSDDNGELTWGEVRRRWPEIVALTGAGLGVTVGGQPCRLLHSGPPQLETHTDGRYAVLTQQLDCAVPVQAVQLRYTLFARSDAGHRGLAAGTDAAGQPTPPRLLVPGDGPQTLTLADTAANRVGPSAGASAGARRAASPDGRAADAHGVHAFAGFLAEGVRHIASGADHLLFLATLLVVAVWRREGRGWVPREHTGAAWREALKLVSAFTVSHSLTLGLAAAGVLSPPSRWVETAIALSVLVAALDNLWPRLPGPRWAIVSVFGLVHGFGFAGPLQDLGLQRGALALPLLGFNLGVEIGQLAVVALVLPLACLLRARPAWRWGVVRGGSAAVALLAGLWTVERSFAVTLLP